MGENTQKMLIAIISTVVSMLALGVIVWGIQLNVGYSVMKGVVAANSEQIKLNTDINREQSILINRTTLLQESLMERMKAAEQHVEEHEKSADDWKRRILLNEERIRNHNGQNE